MKYVYTCGVILLTIAMLLSCGRKPPTESSTDPDPVPGDINLNDVANEIADAVLLANYFVWGEAAFKKDTTQAIANSDVNRNGVPLEIADLQYLISIIVGNAVPYHRLEPREMLYHIADDGTISVGDNTGSIWLEVEGQTTPFLLAHDMNMFYDFDREVTRILITSFDQRGMSGPIVRISGKVLGVKASHITGSPTTPMPFHPVGVALYPAYPNPFKESTTITFAIAEPSDYRLVIFDVLGEPVAEYYGRAAAGTMSIKWDGGHYPPGTYFYRLEVGEWKETRKLMLLGG